VAAAWLLAMLHGTVPAQAPTLTLEALPRPATPPAESGPVVPTRVLSWRQQALALEHGDGMPRDPVRAAELYCRAARYGDAESQFNLAWMLTNARGIERDDAQAAHLFAAAAEQGLPQAVNMLASMGTPRGAPPACLRQPEEERPAATTPAMQAAARQARAAAALPPLPPIPANAPAPIVNFVKVIAPDYKLEPQLVLAIIATESNFDPFALSPKQARGLMQLIPDTASRFNVRNPMDPVQNIRGGMAYLRWLMAYFEGDVALVAAAYNAGEGAVERYLGVPPYAETRNYVRRIVTAMGGRVHHPFDPSITGPSTQLALMRVPVRSR
jgi:soluble lytic murein transglycosylase-like protein